VRKALVVVRSVISGAAFVLLTVVAGLYSPSSAQEYPDRLVRIISPYPAGGQNDIVARLVGGKLARLLGQPFIIENRPGAGGAIGVDALKKSPPDGYTLLLADAGQWAITPILRPQLYEPEKDLAAVGRVTTSSLFLAAHQSVPVNNLNDLIALAKSSPDKLTYGSSGIGSVHHLSMEAFKAALDLKIVHIPYKGTSQSVPGLIAGDTSLAITGLSSVAQFVDTRQVKLLGANTKKRSRLAPEIPSMAEAGVPDFDFPGELGLFAPAGTPTNVIAKISAALATAIEDPDVQQRFFAMGVEASFGTPEQLKEVVRVDLLKYANAIRVSGAKIE
jgi:tripartite-type tricarboxylate transporter receptor subunit TctC